MTSFYKEYKKGYIYLIYDQNNNSLKIGFSKNPKSNKLFLIDYFKGNTKDEKILHKKFKSLRLASEWFEYHTNIIKEFKNK